MACPTPYPHHSPLPLPSPHTPLWTLTCGEGRVGNDGPLELHVGHEQVLLPEGVLQDHRLRDALQLLLQGTATHVTHVQTRVLHAAGTQDTKHIAAGTQD
jgi:hypothetical protein